jgi:glycosyltransferase involved in cell wall biosynthesis
VILILQYLIESTSGGFTFPEAQPKALAEKLSKLITNQNLRLNLGKKGRQAVVQSYTNSALAKHFADTIESVL